VRRLAVLTLALLALAGACREKPAPLTHNLAVENKVAVRPVTLFFETSDMLLGRVPRNLALPENPAGALSVVTRELVKSSGGSHEELMAVYSIVSTVTTNFPEVKRVRILVNGEPAETLAGHVSLRKALVPMPSLVAGRPPA
jgi:hypothetical protein